VGGLVVPIMMENQTLILEGTCLGWVGSWMLNLCRVWQSFMELILHFAFNSLRYGVYKTMLQVHGHHKLNLYMLLGMNWGLYLQQH
jgi:hypothetical protein